MSDPPARIERRARQYVEEVLSLESVEAVTELFAHPSDLETLDRERTGLLDRPAGKLFEADPPAAGTSVVTTGSDGHRHFEVDASALSGPDGERLGRMLVFHEITERRRRVQQLGVLDRVLPHNLRNDLTVVTGVLDDVDESAVEDVTRGDVAVLTIADDGPGLPDHERQVLASGFEEALTHGSGLSLWPVHWAFEASGAAVDFDVGDGTTARATFPLARAAQ